MVFEMLRNDTALDLYLPVETPDSTVPSPSPVSAKKRGRPRIHRDGAAKTAASRQRELDERASRLDRLLVLNQRLEKRQKDYITHIILAIITNFIEKTA